MARFSNHIEHYRIGFLGLSLLVLSSVFVLGGPMDIPSQTWGTIFMSLAVPYLLLVALFRSFVRAAAPAMGVVASLAVVHAVSAMYGFSTESVEALFFLTLLATGAIAIRASVAIMTSISKFGRCDPDELPLKEIALYGFAALLAGVVALGDIFMLADRPAAEVLSFVLVAGAAPLFGFGLFFFLIIDSGAAGKAAVAHHNQLLAHAAAFETVGAAAHTEHEGRGLLLFMIPLVALVIAVYTGAEAFEGFAASMLWTIGGLTGIALFAGKSFRSALVIGLSLCFFTGLIGFVVLAWEFSGQDAARITHDTFAALSAATAVMLPPSIYLYKLCELQLLKGESIRNVLRISAVRGVAMFILTSGLFTMGAVPWMVLGSRSEGFFAFLFAAFLILGTLLVPLFGLSLFAMVEKLFPRRVLATGGE